MSAASGELDDSFDVQLVIDPSLYPADIHFLRESMMLVDKLHFTLDVKDDKDKPFSRSQCPGMEGPVEMELANTGVGVKIVSISE